MKPLSAKYGALLVAVLLAGAVPGIASLRSSRGRDLCVSPAALEATSLIAGSTALGERLEDLTPATFQWSEGTVPHPILGGPPMRFQLLRSFDGPSLYERPVRFAGEKLQPEQLTLNELEVNGEILPVHVVWDHTQDPSRLIAYFFVFDNQPVRSPLIAQLVDPIGIAMHGPRPTTLVLISGVGSPQTTRVVEEAALAWLRSAWLYIAHSCRES